MSFSKVPFKFGLVALSEGPGDERISMFNALADSIWAANIWVGSSWMWAARIRNLLAPK